MNIRYFFDISFRLRFQANINMGIVEKEKYSAHFKEIEEEYDRHINDALPDHLHRGDIVSASRLLGYADAMMATCATFLVIPIRNLTEMKPEETLPQFLHENYTQFIMYFLGFFVVCTVWESLNMRFIVIKRLDDFLVLICILSMLVTTVLPFSLALQGFYSSDYVTVLITCLTLFLIELLEIATILYAFASPRLLHFQFNSYTKQDRRLFCVVMCIKSMVNSLIVVIGGAFCLLHVAISMGVYFCCNSDAIDQEIHFICSSQDVLSIGHGKKMSLLVSLYERKYQQRKS